MPGAVARPSKGGPGPADREDAFIRALNRFIAWAQENTGTVMAIAIVLAVALGGAFYWNSYRQNLEERASADFATLQTRIVQGAGLAVTDSLQAFLDRFGGTQAAREARILLSRQQLEQDQASRAAESIRPVVSSHAPDTPTGLAARRLLAEAQVGAGDTAAALATLEELAGNARFRFQRHEAAADRASLLADRGRLEEARDVYRRLAEEASGTEAGDVYAVRLGEIEGRIDSGGTDASAAPADTTAEG